MSKDLTSSGAAGTPLTSELFQSNFFKPTQGLIVRRLTALAIAVIVGLGCWRLASFLPGVIDNRTVAGVAIPGALLLGGLWFAFRIVNWPRFAEFLIAVEAEMNKVTWPSKDELVRASIVVMFTIFFLAITLFAFDVIWQFIFNVVGVTS
ncbi:MAG: preprotein translocase subunit SecE [Planctomycetota bacterium]